MLSIPGNRFIKGHVFFNDVACGNKKLRISLIKGSDRGGEGKNQ
jgi:hypothetical protein